MLRNVYFVLVLAALAATSAAASPVVPAKAGKLAHHKAVHATARATRRAAAKPRAHAPAAHKSRPAAPAPRHAGPASGRSRVSHRVLAPPKPMLRRASFVRRVPIAASPLKGSLESLERQNERAEADGLERILDEDDLAARIDQKLLVPIPESPGLAVNSDLSENHRYCRPWTSSFLADLSSDHEAQFHKPLTVSSAVRTVEYQQELMRTNHNAAAAEGDVVSPHLTGGTIDIAKSGMTRQELVWMRNHLLALQLTGMIDVEEEFRQPCFHITVYKNYVAPVIGPAPQPHRHLTAPAVTEAAGEN